VPSEQGRSMLVINRKKNEKILIGEDVEVTVLEVRGDKVRLGIKAPRSTEVDREEVRISKRQGRRPELMTQANAEPNPQTVPQNEVHP
jgi:carbon storage regulator